MSKYSLRHTIRQGLNGLFHICKEELKMAVRDQGVLIFFLLVPLAYPLVYAFIYTNEVVREVPAAVVDDNKSAQSREYLRWVDGSPDIHIVSYCADMEEAKLLLKQQKIYGIIRIPETFSSDLTSGTQTRVSIYADMSGMLYYKALLLANTEASLKMNKEIQIQRAGNTTGRQDEITVQPLDYEDVSLYNPQDGFASFLIPAVLVLIIQQTLLLGIGLSAGTARENNRFRDLVPIGLHYQGTLRIVLGKSSAYLLIYMAVAAYILCLVPKMFRLVQLAQPDTLLAFVIPFLLACIFFAMACSCLIRRREDCMMIFVFTSLPLLFISGISWPGSAIPPFWKIFSWLFPSTFGINGYIRIQTMGASLSDVLTEYRALWLQAGIYFLLTCFLYRRQILLSRKHALARLQAYRKKRQVPDSLIKA
ncbi:ABC transporter permease [Bacteroides gallinaceum]|uniref:ABC transporter permease n=1 Tax=Bacteroides gallinaceum TaxID=1462571 RepID=UPI0025A3997A|nr:ABC transporter permease [Bacteroides gallinaceum]MDM8153215.1 ABC transporter permease [Bacteroides gallinaceum]